MQNACNVQNVLNIQSKILCLSLSFMFYHYDKNINMILILNDNWHIGIWRLALTTAKLISNPT